MPEPTFFHDLPILGELSLSLDAAMARAVAAESAATTVEADAVAAPTPHQPTTKERRPGWRRVSGRPLPTIVVALLLGGLGTSTAAATLTVLRGSPIPVPLKDDVQQMMTPQTGTATVLPLRAKHLGAGAPFALRTSKSETASRA